MLTGESRIPIKTSNPEAALKQIQGKALRWDGKHNEALSEPDTPSPVTMEAAETLRVGAALGANLENVNAGTPDQNQELLVHLQNKERELAEVAANHQVSVWNWQQEVGKQQTRLEQRKESLDAQEQNLRALQFELFQLQNDLIESQLATREIVESLNLPGQEQTAAEALKLEIGQRFDHMMGTWNAFAQQMESLVDALNQHAQRNE